VPEIRRAQIEIAASIDRACLEDDDVDRVNEAPIVIRDFTKVDREVIAASVIVLSAVVAGVMEAERLDMMAFGISVKHGAGALRQTMADLVVGDFPDAGAKRFVEDIGLAQ
jgi:phosphoglycerate dehydrogenase-like enzyme